jgi:hypothetical protein
MKPPFTVRPLGACAWEENLPSVAEALRSYREAEALGLSYVMILDADGQDVTDECVLDPEAAL